MRLAVVIPVLNEAERVGAAIGSAFALGAVEPTPGEAAPSKEAPSKEVPPLELVRVVVADGGSTDGSQAIAERAGATVLPTEQGRGIQMRVAIEAAGASRSDAVLMLHADSSLAPDAREQLARALRDPKVVCGAFRQRIDADGFGYRLLEWGNAMRARLLGLPYGDQAIFARTDALDAVGGVPALPLMEDVALMQRLRWRGWPVLLDGPVITSARRWRRHGIVRQTLRNWTLLAAFSVGVPVKNLMPRYEPHQEESED